mgnify:CR=1 FL=1
MLSARCASQFVGMIFQTRSKTILILTLKDKSYNSFFGLRRNTETSQAAVYTPLSRDIQAKISIAAGKLE